MGVVTNKRHTLIWPTVLRFDTESVFGYWMDLLFTSRSCYDGWLSTAGNMGKLYKWYLYDIQHKSILVVTYLDLFFYSLPRNRPLIFDWLWVRSFWTSVPWPLSGVGSQVQLSHKYRVAVWRRRRDVVVCKFNLYLFVDGDIVVTASKSLSHSTGCTRETILAAKCYNLGNVGATKDVLLLFCESEQVWYWNRSAGTQQSIACSTKNGSGGAIAGRALLVGQNRYKEWINFDLI